MKQTFLLFLMLFSCSGALVAAEAGSEAKIEASFRKVVIALLDFDISKKPLNYQKDNISPKDFCTTACAKVLLRLSELNIEGLVATPKEKFIMEVASSAGLSEAELKGKIQDLFHQALIAIDPKFSSVGFSHLSQIQKTELLKKLLEAYLANSQNDHKKIIFQALVKHGGCAVSWVTSEENVEFNIERLKDNNLKICGYFIKVAIPAVVVGIALLMEPVIKKAFRYVVTKN